MYRRIISSRRRAPRVAARSLPPPKPIPGQPRWRDGVRRRHQLPPQVARWLFDRRSTSRLMQEASGLPMRVRVTRCAWMPLSRTEARALGLRQPQPALVREVQLLCGSELWMLARTVALRRALRGPFRWFGALGERPLGTALSQRPRIARSAFQVAQLGGDAPPLSSGLPCAQSVWGRRSLFLLDGQSMLLSEVFMPIFQRWLERSSNTM